MSEPTKTILPSALNPTAAPPRDAAERGRAREKLVDMEAWLTRLTESADFARFLEFVREGADATAEQAGHIGALPVDQAYALAQRFFGLKAMAEWPAKQLAAVREQLRAMDKQA